MGELKKVAIIVLSLIVFAGIGTLHASMEHGAAMEILLSQAKEREVICAESLLQKPVICTKKHRICLVMKGETS